MDLPGPESLPLDADLSAVVELSVNTVRSIRAPFGDWALEGDAIRARPAVAASTATPAVLNAVRVLQRR